MSQVSSLLRNLGRVAPQIFRAEQSAVSRAVPAHLSKMEAYSSTVVRSAEPSAMPKDGADKIHHIVKNGRVTGFKNPYPSWGEGNGLGDIFRAVFW